MQSSFLIIPLLGTLLLLTGCSGKEEPAAPTSPPQAEQAPVSPPAGPVQTAPSNPPPVVVRPTATPTRAVQPPPALPTAPEPLEGEVQPLLTSNLRSFVREQRRFPKDFAELASAKLKGVPIAPEGTEFTIDHATMEVKAVKKASGTNP